MATFASVTFNTARYAAVRPTYPKQLYEFIFDYHRRHPAAQLETAVDLGCGTGQATVDLTPFKHVIGVDPSMKMVESARASLSTLGAVDRAKFRFEESSAENVAILDDGTVDLIIAAQSGHWFGYDKVWPEVARLLRPGGSVALWCYSEMRLTNFPSLTPLITDYFNGTDPRNSIGPYWEQPGRSILEGHLLKVPSATDVLPAKFSEFERIFFTGDHFPELPSPHPVIMRKQMSWDDFLAWLYTTSSLHTFHERFPEDRERSDGDIAVRFWKRLRQATRSEPGNGSDEAIEVEWPLALILGRRAYGVE
ncbi:S-adenosyl-L-methionine-dependent methyltransferase [Lactarius akahatsu]|uniref:S-adenosyl-L-methionine-dependent methyltransferase n=1 Tax=Lactarius akahatsu TaxID=416441 RepID=A0AAD4LQ83_9AGAM|nr:S-adenosyl-L-methionine-dependent methyltransferase [Lactarius akahatsu]